jgi:hypothetical protein
MMMENSMYCTMYLEPILNNKTQCYENILTVSNIPDGSLEKYIKRVNLPRLSEFYPSLYRNNCIFALCKEPERINYMHSEDIPMVIGFLERNEYKIMTDMTNLGYRGPVDYGGSHPNRRFIFMFKYEGK